MQPSRLILIDAMIVYFNSGFGPLFFLMFTGSQYFTFCTSSEELQNLYLHICLVNVLSIYPVQEKLLDFLNEVFITCCLYLEISTDIASKMLSGGCALKKVTRYVSVFPISCDDFQQFVAIAVTCVVWQKLVKCIMLSTITQVGVIYTCSLCLLR